MRRIPVSILCVFCACVLCVYGLAGCGQRSPEPAAEPAATDTPAGPTESHNTLVQNRGENKDFWWHELPRESWGAFETVEQAQPWFEVYAVADGVFAIYEPGQFEEVISYLILGTERALLFDTGLGIGDMHRLVSELTELPVTVVNSHSHYDHIGSNHAFDTVFSPDTEYTRQRSRGLEHGEVADSVGPGWIWKITPEEFDPATYAIEPYSIARTLEDGERIDLGGRVLEVLLTPGHAPDALCLLDRGNRLLFTGDTFYLAPLYTHLEGSSFDQYLRTAERLAELASEVDYLMPGHNETRIDSAYLGQMREAFERIQGGMEPTTITDGHREYSFEGFSVMTNDPVPKAGG